MPDATCQSCGVGLRFVENVASGAKLPLCRESLSVSSLEQVKSGMVVVSPNGRKGKIVTLAALAESGEAILAAAGEGRLFVTHFGDCPDREKWQGSTRRAAAF